MNSSPLVKALPETSSSWPVSPTFVLGIPRSGTTWLANILDASPQVRLFMEPFSTIARHRFPEIPDTSLYFDSSPPEFEAFLRGPFFDRLQRGKYLFTSKSLVSNRWFRTERMVAKTMLWRSGRIPWGWRNRITLFQLLNLNRFDKSYQLYPKGSDAVFPVIKELRLAGKLPSLFSTFPESKFVAVVRHPCATVNSILDWFNRGNLNELRNELISFVEAIETQRVGNNYRSQIELCRNDSSLAAKIALYWRISFDTIYSHLMNSENGLMVAYEQLSTSPESTIRQICDFVDLPWSENFDDYLKRSTRHNTASASPTATVRDSASYYRTWCDSISDHVRQITNRMTEGSPVMSLFDEYYDFQ